MRWLFLLLCTTGFACTAFHLGSQDGARLYCRSLEFGFPLESELLIVPRATRFKATTPSGGMSWQVKYGYVGMNQSFLPTLVSDGMNEKGLVVGCLYLPGFAEYQPPDAKRASKSLHPADLASFLLGTCASVAEARSAIGSVLVMNAPLPGTTFILPLHFIVSDASGACIAVEYIAGRLNVHDNPVGVLTNAPSFDWHLTNLSNYINLTAMNAEPLKFGTFQTKPFGQGSGMLGLPGDLTPPSRFVRAALFAKYAEPPNSALDAVRLGFHVLNTFDISPGLVRSQSSAPTPLGKPELERTEWVIVHDQTNLRTYFRSFESLQVQSVEFANLHLEQPGVRSVALSKQFP